MTTNWHRTNNLKKKKKSEQIIITQWSDQNVCAKSNYVVRISTDQCRVPVVTIVCYPHPDPPAPNGVISFRLGNLTNHIGPSVGASDSFFNRTQQAHPVVRAKHSFISAGGLCSTQHCSRFRSWECCVSRQRRRNVKKNRSMFLKQIWLRWSQILR